MGSATLKNKVQSVLKRGNLSGLEVARIALFEIWELEHARDGILSENERKALLTRIANSAETAAEYQDWYKSADSIIELNNQAHIVSLIVQNIAYRLVIFLRRYLMDAVFAVHNIEGMESTTLSVLSEEFWKALDTTAGEYFRESLSNLRFNLSYFCFCRSVLASLEEATNVRFTEDAQLWEEEIKYSLGFLEETLQATLAVSKKARCDIENIDLQPVWEASKPNKELEQAFRQRTKEPLNGSQFVQDCREISLKEMLRELSTQELDRRFLSNPGIGEDARKRVVALLECGDKAEKNNYGLSVGTKSLGGDEQ